MDVDTTFALDGTDAKPRHEKRSTILANKSVEAYSLEELNGYETDRCLRRYQRLILDNRGFSLILDGTEFSFLRSDVSTWANRLYFETADGRFCLVSDGAAEGYKLTANIEVALECHNERIEKPFSLDQSCIVIGHQNFAHFVWNQLSAFNLANKSAPYPYFHYKESFGFAGEIIEGAGRRLELEELCDFKNTVFVGGEFLNHETSGKLTDYMRRNRRSHIRPHSAGTGAVIYLGVRGRGRRELKNEREFYMRLIDELYHRNSSYIFYLDGFSVTNFNRDLPEFLERNQERSLYIDDIIRASKAKNIRSINGMHLLEALSIIEDVDFYVTFEGTMQHKLGWFYPRKRGLILSCSRYQRATAEWHAAQIAGGVAPHYLDDGLVIPYVGDDRDSYFSISNIGIAVKYVADSVEAGLSDRE